jgi:hypothetical protein
MKLTRPRVAGTPLSEIPMPKRSVIECKCDRCHRKSYLPEDQDMYCFKGSLTIPGIEDEPAQELNVSYEVLCQSCGATIHNYLKGIAKLKKDSGANEEGDDPPSSDD